MMKESCDNCKFFNTICKECRRFPPQVYFDGGSLGGEVKKRFPEMKGHEWCGEWQWCGDNEVYRGKTQ